MMRQSDVHVQSLPNGTTVTTYLATDIAFDKEKVLSGVHTWFLDKSNMVETSGDRSIHLAYNDQWHLKIKGSGYKGGEVLSQRLHHTGPLYPRFDFEGKKMVDVSYGHDNACRGGMSFSQAYAEFVMAKRLADAGERIIPCLGWGKLEFAGKPSSWFSVHFWPTHCARPPKPHFNLRLCMESGVRAVRFHLDYGIMGFCENLFNYNDRLVYLYDLHFLRHLAPDDTSAISIAYSMCWSLYVRTLVVEAWTLNHERRQMIALNMYRQICTDANRHDLADFRNILMKPIFTRPWQYDINTAKQVLKGHKISSAIYDHFCKIYPHP